MILDAQLIIKALFMNLATAPDTNVASLLNELPASATNVETLAWVNRMRRLMDRWEELPGYASRSMTPDLQRQAREELDAVEQSVRRNMAMPEGV